MAVFKALGKGVVRSCLKVRVLLDLWVINVLFSLLVAAPLLFLFQQNLGHSFLGRELRTFDFLWLGEAVYRYQNVGPAVTGGLLAAAVFYLLLYVFLNGGLIGRLLDGGAGTKLAAFFGDCGRYFWRFLRLFLLSLPFYAVAFGILWSLLSAVLGPWERNALTEWTVVTLSGVETAFTLLLLTLVHMIFDYARIIVVADDEPRVLRALGGAFAFIGRRFFRAWGLYLLIAAILLGGAALYLYAGRGIPSSGLLFLAVGILWTQAFIVFRLWVKMLFFSGQAEFYRLSRY
jgi:hypothetical protein